MEEEDYDELEDGDIGDGTLGGIIYSHDDREVLPEISFRSIYDDPLAFRDRRRKVFLPHIPLTIRFVKYERNVTHHLLNPYLYTIEVQHGDFTWTIYKRYRHIQLLHQQLKVFRATLALPFPTANHRSDRQSFKELKEKGEDAQGRSRSSLPRFPKKPEVMISYDQIDERMQQLEDYLNRLFNIKLYREHHDSVNFLLCSHLSFVKGLGMKGREGLVKKQTGSTRKGCNCFGLLDNNACLRCTHVCSDTCGSWRERWLFVKDTFLGYIRPRDGSIRGILLFDQGFEVSAGFYSSGMRNRFQVLNLQRRIVFKCKGMRKRQGWTEFIKDVCNRQGYGFTQNNKNSSFAPPRSNCKAAWFVDGASYMSHVAEAIFNAKEEIYIADWWLSPEIYLKRPALHGYHWRLDSLLQTKAMEGVKIFVLLYKEVELALGINSYYSKSVLSRLHSSNIKVLRHPDHANSGVFLWAHHEKIVCVDQNYAFLGGIDLCYGRWDNHEHRLADFGGFRRDPNKRKFTSSRPSGIKYKPLARFAEDVNSIGLGTLSPYEIHEETVEASEGPELEKELADLESNQEKDQNDNENVTEETIDGKVEAEIPDEHMKCDTPDPEPEGITMRLKNCFSRVCGDCSGCGKTEENPQDIPAVIVEPVEVEKIEDIDVKTVEPVECFTVEKTPDDIEIQPEDLWGAKYWIGKDYTNFIVKDFCDLDSPFQDLVDRNTTPRMPWHDIGVMVQGAAARDVARHFIQRWNAVKVEKAKKINSIPYLMPKSYEDFQNDIPCAEYNVKCQVLRSISSWSGGYLDPDIWEESIHEAYITSIAKSQYYIYIENQFFISLARHNSYVKNQIGEALCKRIVKAHKEGKQFRVYVIIPLLPGFEGEVGAATGTALHAITHWNYASICRGNDSIMSRLQELGVENPGDYITFHGLRKHSEFNKDHVTELIYVHSKLMIVDDRLVICGSANINDRSLLGKRDSEIAVLIEDEEFVPGRMNNEDLEVGRYASSLRKHLFKEHLGLLPVGLGTGDEIDEIDVADPISDDFYQNVWTKTSQKNTKIYEEVFRCLPSDRVTTFTDLGLYLEEIPLLASDITSANELIAQIRGNMSKQLEKQGSRLWTHQYYTDSDMGVEEGSYVPSVSAASMVVVSNRLPFILKRNEQTGQLERKASAGGLVTAVAPVVIKGKGIWVGWPGIHLDDPNEPIPESDPKDRTPTAGLLSKQVVAVHCERHLFEMFYNGCCNGTFWPLFHSMPDRAEFSADTWKAYVKVNQEFANKTMQALDTLKDENSSVVPTVWIHDYQLMICANWVRQAAEEAGIRCKMGFFLHIPFPPWDIFRLFPWSDEILQGMLGCDMVGFHIEDYCLNFVDCCQRRLGCRVDRKNLLVEHGGRSVRVRPLPIGIPFERFVQLAESATRVMLTNQKIVLGVDRLDYTKGLVHRLKAFERLLQKYPQHIEKVTLLQIAVPSRTDVREYQELKEEMDQLVGRINGCFTTPNWSPIRYIYGCVSQDELAAFYRDAAVALVTPLRDGMNLVAKEFVACQISTPPGVLIVSPFAGAGEMMHEALVCNPYEIDDAAEVIHRALTMPEDERTLRMNYLRRREKVHDVNYWMRSFLKAMGTLLAEDGEETRPTTMQPVTLDDFDEYLAKYIGSSHKLALLLDYDGTLAPIAPHPDLAILPPETKNVLERLSNQSDVYIAIISGRNVDNVKKMVGIKGITYAGSHGLEILHPDGSKFVHPMPSEFEDKVTELLKALQEQVCKEGAWVENKGAILTFHYRETPLSLRPALVEQAKQLIEAAGFRAGRAHCAIEAKPPVQWNKGRASIYILRTAFGLDWSERIRIIYAGDDTTDEDAMQALKGMAATFRITSSHIVKTAAEYRLPSTDSVLTMLKWVERHLNRREPRETMHGEQRYRSHRANNGVTMEVSYTDGKIPENHIGEHNKVVNSIPSQ